MLNQIPVLCHLQSLDHGKAITWENLSFVIWGWLTLLQPETGLDAHVCLCTAIWKPCYLVYTLLSMRGSRIFHQGGGGPGQSDKKSPDNDFFLVVSLFYWSQMVNFEENYHFQGSRGGPTFSRGSNCLYPIETHITCDFPEGSDPLTPLWIGTCYLDQQEIALVVVGWYFSVLFKFW